MPRANKRAWQPQVTGIIPKCLGPYLIKMTATIRHYITQGFNKKYKRSWKRNQ